MPNPLLDTLTPSPDTPPVYPRAHLLDRVKLAPTLSKVG